MVRDVQSMLQMSQRQQEWTVSSKMVGALPIINHFLEALELHSILDDFVPGDDRSTLAPATALGVLLRNILVSREPLYALPEWSERCEKRLLGLPTSRAAPLSDDRLGRALDKLFLADRAALMTAVVVRAVRNFGLALDELHIESA